MVAHISEFVAALWEVVAIPEDIIHQAQKIADSSEIFDIRTASTTIDFEANSLKAIESSETSGSALRIIKNGRIGFASTTNSMNLSGLVGIAEENSPFGAMAKFEFPPAAIYPDVSVYDQEVTKLSLEDIVALGQHVLGEIRSHSDDVRVEGSVSRADSTCTIFNSNGGHVEYSKTTFGLGFEGTVIRGEDMLFVFDGASSCRLITDVSPMIESIHRQLNWASRIATVHTGEMPVLLMPSAVYSVLLSPLLAGFSGKAVLQGTSPLSGRLGDQIVDERISVFDDPTINLIPGSRPSDDEAIPSRRFPIIEKGKVSNFIYDLQTAGQAGVESTGSGERSLGSLPGPSASVILLNEGESTFEQLIKTIDEGLIVERLLGAGQSNILGGDFSGNILLGYKIERGQVVGRVKNTMLSGNTYNVLNKVIGIGNEARWLGGRLFVPPIACDGFSVSSET